MRHLFDSGSFFMAKLTTCARHNIYKNNKFSQAKPFFQKASSFKTTFL